MLPYLTQADEGRNKSRVDSAFADFLLSTCALFWWWNILMQELGRYTLYSTSRRTVLRGRSRRPTGGALSAFFSKKASLQLRRVVRARLFSPVSCGPSQKRPAFLSACCATTNLFVCTRSSCLPACSCIDKRRVLSSFPVLLFTASVDRGATTKTTA